MRDYNADERARLWLGYGVEFHARLGMRILARYETALAAREAFLGGDPAFAELGERVRTRLAEAAKEGFLDALIERMERRGVAFTYPGERSYPKLLAEISDPPGVLFYAGHLEPEPTLAIAVVGSRHPTRYGTDTARSFAYELVSAGATIISGMAEGVDAAAARGALDCKEAAYPTVAVLGCGADVAYPASNAKLYREIVERGAVVSEFWPGTRPDRIHFPIRNRVMSGMAHGTLVVEAAERSGTSITAGYASEQGRDVFAVPGRISDPMSAGPNRMIARGEAKPVFTPEDVLSEYRVVYEPGVVSAAERVSLSSLSENERRVCLALREGERSFDELCEALDLPAGALNSCLTALEFSGIMKQLPGRVYALDAARTALIDD